MQDALHERFNEAGWVSIEKIEEFVGSDATIYYAGQVRSRALKPMERTGRIEVDPTTRKRRFTYGEGCMINFRPQTLTLF